MNFQSGINFEELIIRMGTIFLKTSILMLFSSGSFALLTYLLIVSRKIRARKLIEKEAPVFINSMIYSLRAGISPVSFFKNYTSSETPLKAPINALLKRVAAGQSLQASCETTKGEIPFKPIHYLLNAIVLNLKNGGNLSPTLEKVKIISQNYLKIKNFIKTKTVQLRLQAYIISSLPLLIFIFLYFFHPEKISSLFSSSLGFKIFCTSICLELLGIVLVHKIVKSPMKESKYEDFLYFLDLLSLTLSSGKNLTSSIFYIKDLNISPKINKFSEKICQDMKKGKTFLECFSYIKKILPSHLSNQIIFIIKENLSHGVSIGNVIEDLATQIRNEMTSNIEEAIEKLPLKLLIPIMIFIAPATMILILFPIIFL